MKKIVIQIFCLLTLLAILSCEVNDPVKEDVPELITKVVLTFTPEVGEPIVAIATDPDGQGIRNFEIETVSLNSGINYLLQIEMFNHITDPIVNISDEVSEEGAEHQIFFKWTNNVFQNPIGDGNIDNPADVVNYIDFDQNNFPIGLQTQWISSNDIVEGKLQIVLKHQPDLKSLTSSVEDGQTDLDISFTIKIM